jgi:hypothetical protein
MADDVSRDGATQPSVASAAFQHAIFGYAKLIRIKKPMPYPLSHLTSKKRGNSLV